MRTYLLLAINCFLCVACISIKKEKKHNPIAGKWNITAIKTKDSILLAPVSTIYNFDKDSTYTVTLHKTDEIIYIYKGVYRFDSEKKILETDYTMDGAQHDEAKIILLKKDELHLVDFKTNDTLIFNAYSKKL